MTIRLRILGITVVALTIDHGHPTAVGTYDFDTMLLTEDADQ